MPEPDFVLKHCTSHCAAVAWNEGREGSQE